MTKAFQIYTTDVLKYGSTWGFPEEEFSDPATWKELWPDEGLGYPPTRDWKPEDRFFPFLEDGPLGESPKFTDREIALVERLAFAWSSETRDLAEVHFGAPALNCRKPFFDFITGLDLPNVQIIKTKTYLEHFEEWLDEPTWYINVHNKIDCIDAANSRVASTPSTLWPGRIDHRVEMSRIEFKTVSLRGDAIAGHHLWRDATYPNALYCSEDFAQSIKDRKFRSLRFLPVEVI